MKNVDSLSDDEIAYELKENKKMIDKGNEDLIAYQGDATLPRDPKAKAQMSESTSNHIRSLEQRNEKLREEQLKRIAR